MAGPELSAELGESRRRVAALFQSGRIDEALALAARIIGAAPDNFEARLDMANLLFGVARPSDASRQLCVAAALACGDASRHFAVAATFHNASLHDRAMRGVKRVLLLMPAHSSGLAYARDFWRGRQDYARSLRYAERLTKITPLSSQAQAIYVLCRFRLGHFDAVSHAARRALCLDPTNASLQLYFAIAETNRSRLDFGEKGAHRATMIQPDWDHAWLTLTGAAFGNGAIKRALKAGLRALSLGANPAETHLWLGRARRALHDDEAAEVHFSETLRLDPSQKIQVDAARLTMTRSMIIAD